MDTTDAGGVRSRITQERPDVVVHAAAIPDPDACHRDPDTAFRVNAVGTRNVALACSDAGAVFVQISTDYVFDGSGSAPHTEFDAVNPINVYGRTKLAAEEYARNLCPRHLIVRTGVLYAHWGKNILLTLLENARQGRPSRAVTDQTGSPTYVIHFAQALDRLLASDSRGLYNVVNSGAITRFEWARRALTLAGLDPTLVQPTTLAEQNRPALRPRFTALRNFVLELEGRDWMPSCEHGLIDCLERLE
jgi:dTDP-4-dehydrorhamnose reductase